MRYAESGIKKNNDRMDTPAFHRNQKFVAEVLGQYLSAAEGDVLEIASGSGQHVVVFAKALPNLTFWPSDLETEQVKSIDAWQQESGLSNIESAFQLDVTDQNWSLGEPDQRPEKFAAIINLNMVHISPIEVAENLFRGAGQYLKRGADYLCMGRLNGMAGIIRPATPSLMQTCGGKIQPGVCGTLMNLNYLRRPTVSRWIIRSTCRLIISP